MLGLGQKEMAEILERSKPTVQAIELGKLRLTEELAHRTSVKTGVSMEWLLDNDTSKPPIERLTNKPYTKISFEKAQSESEFDSSGSNPGWGAGLVEVTMAMLLQQICCLLVYSYTKNNFQICSYKIRKQFEKIQNEYGGTDADYKAFRFFKNDKSIKPNELKWINGQINDKRSLVAQVLRDFHFSLLRANDKIVRSAPLKRATQSAKKVR